MSLSLQSHAAGGADPGQGLARPTPSPSGAPAPSAVDASREIGEVNELRTRPRPHAENSADLVRFSTVGQTKAALAMTRGNGGLKGPWPRPERETPLARDVNRRADERVNESQMQPFKAVFQTLTAKVQFAKSESGEVIVQIVDSRTHEVVRQLPSDAFLRLHNRLEQMASEGSNKGSLLETAV